MSIQYSVAHGRDIAIDENGVVLGVYDPDKYETRGDWRVAMYNLHGDQAARK